MWSLENHQPPGRGAIELPDLAATADAFCGAYYGSITEESSKRRKGCRHRTSTPGPLPPTARSLSGGRAPTSEPAAGRQPSGQRGLTTVVADCCLHEVSTRPTSRWCIPRGRPLAVPLRGSLTMKVRLCFTPGFDQPDVVGHPDQGRCAREPATCP